MKPRFFTSPSALREWFERNHGTERELLVGFYKKATGKRTITWPESVDQALCFGWIDGVRKSLGEVSYAIRFTPRKARSTWSAVNTRRAGELIAEGLMRPAGLRAFQARQEKRSGIYSYEQRPADLPDAYAKLLGKNIAAHTFFQSQPPSYRRAVIWWIVSAKKEETRLKRLRLLVGESTGGRRVPQFTRR